MNNLGPQENVPQLDIPQENVQHSDLLSMILKQDKEMVMAALGDPNNIAVVGSSPKDLALLANPDIKTEILAILHDVSLGDKLALLSELDHNSASVDSFEKKEIPYLSRFTLYSIVKEIITQAGIIRENDDSYEDAVSQILENNNVSADAVVVLKDLIDKSEGHCRKYFKDGDIVKLNIVEKVLKHYT